MEVLDSFFIAYRLEILWLGIFLSAFQLLRKYVKRKSNRDYIRIQTKNSRVLPLTPKPDWGMIVLSLIFGVTGLIITVTEFVDNKVDEALLSLGMSLSLLLSYVIHIETNLPIRSEADTVFINDKAYKAADIKKVELWDDLIFFELTDKKEVKLWLRFKAKNYRLALDTMNLIEDFCLKNDIPVKNSFAQNIEGNEIFNPPLSTSKEP